MIKRSKEECEEIVKNSKSIADVCRAFGVKPKGGNYKCVKHLLNEYNIDYSHFTGQAWNKGKKYELFNKCKPLSEVLVKGSYYSSNKLKERLLKSGIKEHKCECCGNIKWLDKPIKLELHHINGDNTDNRIENISLLCPNCHSYTDTYRSKNKIRYDKKEASYKELSEEEDLLRKEKKKISRRKFPSKIEKPKIEVQKRFCLKCGKELSNKQINFCSYECSKTFYSKKPPLNELMEMLITYQCNFTKIGKHYNVSDNSIKKWCISYNIPYKDIRKDLKKNRNCT